MNRGDRVKVVPTHYGSGLAGRLGTVIRVIGPYAEVEMDSYYQAGIGIVTFRTGDLMSTSKKRPRRYTK